jgi:hypothetical protein
MGQGKRLGPALERKGDESNMAAPKLPSESLIGSHKIKGG